LNKNIAEKIVKNSEEVIKNSEEVIKNSEEFIKNYEEFIKNSEEIIKNEKQNEKQIVKSHEENNKTNEIILLENEEKNFFSSIKTSNFSKQILNRELSGLSVEFDRIKIPAGAGMSFEIPDAETGGTNSVKEFTAVIIHHHPLFSLFKEKYMGRSVRPDCVSFDGIRGIGNPGRNCFECPFKKFGSDPNGGKLCKDKHQIYLMLENSNFPVTMILPSGSLRSFSKYVNYIIFAGRLMPRVVTRFFLVKGMNGIGITYSKVHCQIERDLNEKESELADKLSKQMEFFIENWNFGFKREEDEKSEESKEKVDLENSKEESLEKLEQLEKLEDQIGEKSPKAAKEKMKKEKIKRKDLEILDNFKKNSESFAGSFKNSEDFEFGKDRKDFDDLPFL
jgi:hypothetical protein